MSFLLREANKEAMRFDRRAGRENPIDARHGPAKTARRWDPQEPHGPHPQLSRSPYGVRYRSPTFGGKQARYLGDRHLTPYRTPYRSGQDEVGEARVSRTAHPGVEARCEVHEVEAEAGCASHARVRGCSLEVHEGGGPEPVGGPGLAEVELEEARRGLDQSPEREMLGLAARSEMPERLPCLVGLPEESEVEEVDGEAVLGEVAPAPGTGQDEDLRNPAPEMAALMT